MSDHSLSLHLCSCLPVFHPASSLGLAPLTLDSNQPGKQAVWCFCHETCTPHEWRRAASSKAMRAWLATLCSSCFMIDPVAVTNSPGVPYWEAAPRQVWVSVVSRSWQWSLPGSGAKPGSAQLQGLPVSKFGLSTMNQGPSPATSLRLEQTGRKGISHSSECIYCIIVPQ